MANIKLTLEYDGTDFVGWQYQSNGRSVQEELEKALRQVVQEDVRVIGAGRTDAGVHSRGQVANVVVQRNVDEQTLQKSLNGVLPEDIVVVKAEKVEDGFHARYSAKTRRYKYYINQQPTAVMRRYCWVMNYRLEFQLLNRVAALIVGDHDFQSFCKAESEVDHYRCTVYSAGWQSNGTSIEFDIRANRFLHGMVRALVGTMVDIARGHRRLEDYRVIMEARDRSAAGMAAPAQGLFLEEITY